MINRIPKEIWGEVFVRLRSWDSIKNCRLVCQTWNQGASHFFAKGLKVNIYESNLQYLLYDLDDYAELGPKITELYMEGNLKQRITTMLLQPIIHRCPNLTLVCLSKKNAFPYILNLLDASEYLVHLQQVRVENLKLSSPSVRRLHAAINCRLCTTITVLELTDVNKIDTISKHGGLLAYLQYFVKLKDLKVMTSNKPGDTVESINLPLLLNCCPTLKSLRFFGYNTLVDTSATTSLEETKEFDHLECLEFEHMKIAMDVIKWVTAKLPRIHDLSLVDSMVLLNRSRGDGEAALKQFLVLYTAINTKKLVFWFDGWMYFMDRQEGLESVSVYKTPYKRLTVTEGMPYDCLFSITDEKIRVV